MTMQYKQLKNDIRKYLSGAKYGAKGLPDPYLLQTDTSKDFVSTRLENRTFSNIFEGKEMLKTAREQHKNQLLPEVQKSAKEKLAKDEQETEDICEELFVTFVDDRGREKSKDEDKAKLRTVKEMPSLAMRMPAASHRVSALNLN